MDNNQTKDLSALYVLVAIIALCWALYSALGVNRSQGGDVAAYVNRQTIPQAEYARAIEAMQSGLQRPLTPADQERALSRLIDEELIVQDALRLGLANEDRLVRKNLVQAMMRSVISLGQTNPPSENTLRDFYLSEQALFVAPRQYSLQAAQATPQSDAPKFLAALDSEASFQEAARAGKFEIQRLPSLIPVGKISDLLGGKAAELAVQMKPGDIAGPVEAADTQLFLWLTDTSGGETEFAAIKDQVRAEYDRRQEEAALEKYLTRLRKQARIRKAAEIP
jgi:hypothetical protein